MSTPSSPDSNLPNLQNLKIQDEKVIFGIDLGTNRTRVALVKPRNNPYESDFHIVADIPSVVSYTKNAKCLVGPCASRRIVSSPKHTFHATKTIMSRNYDDPVVEQFAKTVGYDILRSPDGQACVLSANTNQILTPGQIATLIFLKLKELCLNELKQPMKNVVITTPAHFTENQIKCTKEAAQMAGLNVFKMLNESTTAFVPFGANKTHKTFVVYDFGGTFKVSVLEIRDGKPEIKSHVYDLFLGGDDFDNVLVNYFVENLKHMTGVDVSENVISMQWLKIAAQNAQIDLCSATELDVFFYVIRIRGKPDRISIKLSRSKFEELVAELINKTIPLCHKALEDAKVAVSDIDQVFAIGGVCRIPKVRAIVQEIFNKIPEPSMNRGDRVIYAALGAAAIGQNLITAGKITDDDVAFAHVPPPFLKPCEETEVFNYSAADDHYDDNFIDKLFVEAVTSGIVAIYSEEEIDHQITHRYRFSQHLDKDGDFNFIPAYQMMLEIRRSNPEKEISDDIQGEIDMVRKGRDDFVMEELCRSFVIRQ